MTSAVHALGFAPTFFGATERQLYGVHHEPTRGDVRRVGVVLCGPGPHEQRHAHRALRALAARLADEGFATLRFDWYGTGDSAGDSDAGSIATWIDDVRLASRELRDHAGVRRIALVGLRLGATIAARACGGGLATTDLVLWDPVVSGSAYLAQLDAAQAWQQREAYYPEDPDRAPNELVGYPMTPAMRTELRGIALDAESLGTPARIVLVTSAAHDSAAALGTRATSWHRVEDPSLANPDDWQREMRLARKAPAAIVGHLVEHHA